MPTYQPERWNDADGIQRRNNCFDYARDQQTGQFTQPGRNHGIRIGRPYECRQVGDAAESEGVRRIFAEGECGDGGSWQAALVVDPNPIIGDYHWYRRDDTGRWSHKPGRNTARDVDASGNPIDNPERADIRPYTQFCGFFCVRPVEAGTTAAVEASEGSVSAPYVELLLYSGRENPALEVGGELLEAVAERLADLQPSETAPGGDFGYSGCIVDFGETESGSPEAVRVFDGVVAVEEAGGVAFFSDDRELEALLLGFFRDTEAWEEATLVIAQTDRPGAVARQLAEEA